MGRAAARGHAGGARSSTAPRPCSCPPTPTIRRAGDEIRAALLAARTGARSPPGTTRSSRRGTAWRSLALAEAGAALGRPDWVAAADAAADLLLERHVVDGRLRRSSRDGAVGAAAGVLEDHADLAEALLALHQATGSAHRLSGRRGARPDPRAFTDAADGSATAGGFFDTADDAEALLHRPREITDNATPCGAAAARGRAADRVRAGRRPAAGTATPAEAALRDGGRACPALPPVRRPLADGRRGRGAGPAAGRGGRRRRRAGRARRARARDRPRRHGRRGRPAGRSRRAAAGRPPARRRRRRGLRLPRASSATAPSRPRASSPPPSLLHAVVARAGTSAVFVPVASRAWIRRAAGAAV